MAATLDVDDFAPEHADKRASGHGDVLPEEILRPVIAGAFARGVADTLTLLDLPALFLDREGRVLFVNDPAKLLLDGSLQVRAGHLLARSRRDNRSLASFLAAVLHDPTSRPSVHLEVSGLALRALPAPGGAVQMDQLLHAVLLIS